jgi:hypothetical protein
MYRRAAYIAFDVIRTLRVHEFRCGIDASGRRSLGSGGLSLGAGTQHQGSALRDRRIDSVASLI